MNISLELVFFIVLVKFVYPRVESDEILDTIGLIEKYNYPAEQHNVTTEDGYILNIFRIPWSPAGESKNEKNKPVIFLLAGIISTSDAWIFFGRNKSLALELADEGYDVWIGNYRGSTYGRAHVTLSPDEKKFWDFSFHEIGAFDLPAMINFILNNTNEKSLTYIGHSMATTAMFVTLSEHEEFNQKISLVIGYTPIAAWFIKNPLRTFIFNVLHFVGNIIDPTGQFELLSKSPIFKYIFEKICIDNKIVDYCLFTFDILAGSDPYQFELDTFFNYLNYYPTGTSLKTVQHYVQLEKYCKFRRYNYENEEENIRHYGQKKPPTYNLKNVRAPMLFFFGLNDPLSTAGDALEIMRRVSSKVIAEPVQFKYFNHNDFFLAKDLKKLVNNQVMERLKQFREEKIFF